MKGLLRGLVLGVVGVAFVIGMQLAFGARIDVLQALVAGGIVIAISIAIELGKEKGVREADFGDRKNG